MERFQDKKQWLLQYRELMEEVERETSDAGYWKDKAYGLGAVTWDNLGIKNSTHTIPLEKFLELAEKCERLANKAQLKKEQILEAIEQVEDDVCQRFLKFRYIDGLKYYQIAERMDYSIDHLYKINKRAITLFEIPKDNSK